MNSDPCLLLTVGWAWLRMERGEQEVEEERSGAHSTPTELPLGEEKGRRTRGWGTEPMEVLSPDGQVFGCFTQPHLAGAMCRLAVFRR